MPGHLRYVPAAAIVVFALTVMGAATNSAVDDTPLPFREYPADEANKALRIGADIAVYAMTH